MFDIYLLADTYEIQRRRYKCFDEAWDFKPGCYMFLTQMGIFFRIHSLYDIDRVHSVQSTYIERVSRTLCDYYCLEIIANRNLIAIVTFIIFIYCLAIKKLLRLCYTIITRCIAYRLLYSYFEPNLANLFYGNFQFS